MFVSVRGLSLVVASGGHSSSRCMGLSLSRPLLLQSTGSRHTGSVVVAHGPSCCTACGIFPDKGSNPCPLHWQADSQPLHHQGSPPAFFWLPFAWNIFFHPLTFSLYVSLGLKWVSCSSIYMVLVFVSIQPVYVFRLEHLIHLHLRYLSIYKSLLPFS